MMKFLWPLFSYVLLLLILWRLPDKIWDKILGLYQDILFNFANRRKRLPILGEIYRGEELLLCLSECEARMTLGIRILSGDIPKFKFYTDLLEHFFENHRRLGIGIKKIIPEVRGALLRDLQFEKKVLDEIMSAFLQFLGIGATTWSFVFLSKSLVPIPLHFFTICSMLALEIIGIFAFFFLMQKFKKSRFTPFSGAIEEVYLFSTLLDVGLPINEILQRSSILSGRLVAHKYFQTISGRVKKLISRMKETGLSPKDEVNEVISEIWHLQEVHFAKFTKFLQVLKFAVLAFFFLPAYFIYLYSIFKFFMEQ